MRQNGTSEDPVIAWMKANDIEVTRENYIDIAYMGDPPPDDEIELPEELQEE